MPRRLLPLLLALCCSVSAIGAGQPLADLAIDREEREVALTAGARAATVVTAIARRTAAVTATGTSGRIAAVTSAPTSARLATAGPETRSASKAAPASATRPARITAASSGTGPGGTSAANGGFSMNLYRRGDFVTQYTKTWCVAAAVQMMLNMPQARDDVTKRTQARLFHVALALSQNPKYRSTSEKGWAAALTRLGAGRYEVRTERTRERAIHAAADAIRRTGRPAGLLTWRGAHSWVMHGFAATADPLVGGFEVTGVYVSDPWYPKVSTIWGPSLPPNALMTPRQLRVDYLPWVGRGGRTTAHDGTYVLVLPVAPPPSPAVSAGGSALLALALGPRILR